MSGERLRDAYPMDGVNLAPYHPHCMCRVQTVPAQSIAEVEADLRRMVELSREQNVPPTVNPADVENFTQGLLGEAVWNITRQVLPGQPRLF
jgi:hypothetical protein